MEGEALVRFIDEVQIRFHVDGEDMTATTIRKLK